jgi:hypothetical protein
MNYQTQKINFYQKRSFGENITATFDFLKSSWKPIIRLCLYILLPLSVVQGVFMNNFSSAAIDSAKYPPSTMGALSGLSYSVIINYLLLIIFYVIGQTIVTAIVYTVMQKYQSSEKLEKYTLSDIKDDFISCLKQCFILTFYVMIIVLGYAAIVGVSAALFPYLLFLIIPGTFALIIPFSLIFPAYIFGEETGTNNALKQAFRLGFPTWGSLFLLIVILTIISSIIQTITFIPWYAGVIIKNVLGLMNKTSEASGSIWSDFLMYILAAIQVFGSYLAVLLVLPGVAFHYFSASEAKDSVSVNNDIENFEQL